MTNTVCHASVFTSTMAMFSNSTVIFICSKIFLEKLSQIYHSFASSYNFNCSFVNGNIFSFQNQIHLLGVPSKIDKTFSYNLFHNIKYVYFLFDQILKLLTLNIYKEYDHLFLLLTFLHYLFIHLLF